MSVKRKVTVPLGSSRTAWSLRGAGRPGAVERLPQQRFAERLEERSLELPAEVPRVLFEGRAERACTAPQLDGGLRAAPARFRRGQAAERTPDHASNSRLLPHGA